jgi:hypothetical protein
MYTNQNYIPIAKIALDGFFENCGDQQIKKYLVSNAFNIETKHLVENFDIELFDSNVPFSDGGYHYGKTILNLLDNIETDYVMILLDDYVVTKPIKWDNIRNLIKVMSDQKIDYFSFMSYSYDWSELDINYTDYGLENQKLMIFDNSYFYMYSVQPCIWKRESLKEFLQKNQNLALHNMDTSNILNKKGMSRGSNNGEYYQDKEFYDYNFKNVCFKKHSLNTNYAFDEHNGEDDYLFFLYSEIIRWGKFNLNTHQNNKTFINKLFKKYNISKESSYYNRFL